MSIEFVGNKYEQEKILRPSCDVTFYTDTLAIKDDKKFKIYLQQEPITINNTIIQVPNHWEKFNVILTYNDDVIKKCPNARFFYFQTVTWIQPSDYMNIDISKKEFKISNLTGGKRMCDAHMFRHFIYFNQELFDEKKFVFFRSSAPPLLPDIRNNPFISKDYSSKIDLFRTFQFSLIIENTRERHCFTEKLMDCLVTKTIPIYYGCENVGDYFDTTGWILIESQSPDEILKKCSALHENYYNEYSNIVEKNYYKALTLVDNYKNLNGVLATIPGYKDN